MFKILELGSVKDPLSLIQNDPSYDEDLTPFQVYIKIKLMNPPSLCETSFSNSAKFCSSSLRMESEGERGLPNGSPYAQTPGVLLLAKSNRRRTSSSETIVDICPYDHKLLP